jgi:hypothetical protein
VVVIFKKPHDDDQTVRVVTFGSGEARVYEKDQIDTRAYLGDDKLPPFFEKPSEAFKYIDEHRNMCAQLPLWAAQRLGLVH